MSWLEEYHRKLKTADEAVQAIQSHQRVYYGGNAAIPRPLVDALARRAPQLQGVQLNHVLLLGKDPLSTPEMEGHMRHNSLFVGPADRPAINSGRGDYMPIFLHQIPRLFYERIIPLDVAMVMVSRPDEHGFMSMGVETLATRAATHSARHVIVQVNPRVPRVLGDSFLHVGRVHAIVEHEEALPEIEPHPITALERTIGGHIRGLIEDGACIQMGIGGIPDAVWDSLDGLKDMGIHTEMISDCAMRAIQKGLVTGSRKTLHPGKVVVTFALGTTELYSFLDNNPLVEAHPVEHVNDPFIISQNDNMIAINSAIEVDLTGQVCADSIGARIYSGFGGQVDFIRGAARSRGGKPIIALPSTAKNDTESRIVPYLKKGAGVVTTRADVHFVVTEYGVARMFGRNLRERAEALISVAHPKFRAWLETEAKERKLL
ncbi:MAG: 4-hydroxybutyrate CoA-transferase [Candidatus Riflebacteria bacterium]|nr:4-hydroxybutyrate CoA-transferase [Candidatus Riflebacteria bacterium]